ncbi:MAG: hypothetical protein NTZ68_01100 [Candidatus Dependentiae bacterium]|nr:hypothetical protein [Candidatus Dependentiae bacterium]
MKKGLRFITIWMLTLSAGKILEGASFKSMPDIVKESSSIVPFLVDPSSTCSQLNVAVNDNNSTFSAVNISLPSAHLDSGFLMLCKNLDIQHQKSGKHGAVSFDYAVYDLVGNQLSENNVAGNDSLKDEPSKMHFALGNGKGSFVEASWVPWNNSSVSLFMCHSPAVWNPVTSVGALPTPQEHQLLPLSSETQHVSHYVHKNIGKGLVSAGIPLHKAQLENDLQIMLISTQASKPTSFSTTIVCSLDGSAKILEKEGSLESLTDGVYIVLSKPLAATSSSATLADLTYLVYNKTGTLLGAGKVSTFGAVSLPKGAVIDGMLLFGSGFSNAVHPLKVSAGKIPQLFLLQYPAITPPGKGKQSSAQKDAIIKQLQSNQAALNEKISKSVKRYKKDTATYVPGYLSNLITEQHNLIQSQAQLINLLHQ